MNKSIDHYMSLSYPIQVVKIEDSLGGGYEASIPMLGSYAFCAEGETIEEAVNNLDTRKRDLFEKYVSRKISIPEPKAEDKYSGKFLLRLPKELHKMLAEEAKRNETTLNQYCIYLLTYNATLSKVEKRISVIGEDIENVKYLFKPEGTQLKNRFSIYSQADVA
ncbi:MAG: toxin-antitoxin system HicB family antitoxin [Fibrobacter sp.]|nr:toxin-antitoxin system HicB family antitoxin [Fibrobacter sp.]